MEDTKNNKHGTGAFVLSGISFIPLIGVIPGRKRGQLRLDYKTINKTYTQVDKINNN